MQCKICKKNSDEVMKIKDGCICQSCLDDFPDSVRINTKNFTTKQLKKIRKFVKPASSKKWIESGTFGVGKNSVFIKNYEFQLKDLRSVKLNFHPKQVGSYPNTVYGTITVVIETKMPHFLFEEPFFPNDITVSYGIHGKSIYYHYSYAIENLFDLVQECIDRKTYDMTEYIEIYQKRMQKEEEYKKKKAAAEAAKAEKEKAMKEEERKRKEREKAHTTNNSQDDKKKQKSYDDSYMNVNRTKKLSPFEEAKLLFGVEIPYTELDIKKIRNRLMKKYHPDMGGSEDMCKKINEAYMLLSKFAKS